MRLISCGVKLFTRQESSKEAASIYRCKWRLNSEGLEVVRPYLGEKRILTVSEETLRQCMEEVSIKLEDLKEEGLEARMRAMEPGSAVLRVQNAKGKDVECACLACLGPRNAAVLTPTGRAGSARTCTSHSGSANRAVTSWSKRSRRGASRSIPRAGHRKACCADPQ